MPYSYYPNENRANSHPLQGGLSSTASVVFVSVSAVVVFLLLLVRAFYYCTRNYGEIIKPAAARPPFSLPVVSYNCTLEDVRTRGCAVCLSEFEEEEAVKVIPGCGHVFHPECIDLWLVKRPSCPVCRCEKISGGGVGAADERCVVVTVERS